MDRELIMFENDFGKDGKGITRLVGNTTEETLYAEYVSNTEGRITYDTIELAVHVDDLIKVRDFCNKLISKIGPAGTYTTDNILIKVEGE